MSLKSAIKILGVALLAIAGFGILSCAALCAYFHLAMPEPPVVEDGDLRIIEPAVPDDENAYAAFLAVTNRLDCSPEDRSVLSAYFMYCSGFPKPFNSWRKDGTPDDCRAEVDRILSERAAGLEGLRQVVLRPKYLLIPDADGSFFPPISMMTLAHTLLRAQADRARERGDFAAAFTAERNGFLFATLCRDNASTLVECNLGSGLGGLSCRRMVSLANGEGVSDGLLAAVDELLKDDFDEKALFEQTVRREYVNFCCRMLDKAGEPMSSDELCRLLPDLLSEVPSTGIRTECFSYSGIVRISGLARFAYNREMTRQDMVNVFRAGLADRDVEGLVPSPRSVFQPNFIGRIIARSVAPSFKDVRRHLKESLFALRAARTAVAIRRYGLANRGAIPSDLSALVPTYLAEVPRDPFAPDRVLGYDATVRQLWTVGVDGDFSAIDSEQTGKCDFSRKRAKCVFRFDGKRIE